MPLLERLTIALIAVLLVAALVGLIKYDMERIAASTPAARARFDIIGPSVVASGHSIRATENAG